MLDAARLRALDESQPDALEHLGCGSRSPHGTRSWAVCQTHPQSERWALANLQRQGFTAYLPLHTVLRRDPVLRTMTRQVEAPLFTSYLFVQPGTHWAPIAHTLGISKLLMAGEKPQLCQAGAVEAVQAAVEALRTHPTDPTAGWHPGASCAVANGALAGHHGVVVRLTASHAVVALLLMGRLVEASVRLDALARPTA
jgi:transcriptional antiterminator RfaH